MVVRVGVCLGESVLVMFGVFWGLCSGHGTFCLESLCWSVLKSAVGLCASHVRGLQGVCVMARSGFILAFFNLVMLRECKRSLCCSCWRSTWDFCCIDWGYAESHCDCHVGGLVGCLVVLLEKW